MYTIEDKLKLHNKALSNSTGDVCWVRDMLGPFHRSWTSPEPHENEVKRTEKTSQD